MIADTARTAGGKNARTTAFAMLTSHLVPLSSTRTPLMVRRKALRNTHYTPRAPRRRAFALLIFHTNAISRASQAGSFPTSNHAADETGVAFPLAKICFFRDQLMCDDATATPVRPSQRHAAHSPTTATISTTRTTTPSRRRSNAPSASRCVSLLAPSRFHVDGPCRLFRAVFALVLRMHFCVTHYTWIRHRRSPSFRQAPCAPCCFREPPSPRMGRSRVTAPRRRPARVAVGPSSPTPAVMMPHRPKFTSAKPEACTPAKAGS